MKRLLIMALILPLIIAGCISTPVVEVKTVHIDRAEIILARQGIEENQTALQILMNAFVPMAEVSAAVLQPWVGAVVVAAHAVEAISEKVGDAGGDTLDTAIYEGKVAELIIGFQGNGLPETVTVKMQAESE